MKIQANLLPLPFIIEDLTWWTKCSLNPNKWKLAYVRICFEINLYVQTLNPIEFNFTERYYKYVSGFCHALKKNCNGFKLSQGEIKSLVKAKYIHFYKNCPRTPMKCVFVECGEINSYHLTFCWHIKIIHNIIFFCDIVVRAGLSHSYRGLNSIHVVCSVLEVTSLIKK